MKKETLSNSVESINAASADTAHTISETVSSPGLLHNEYTWISLAFVITIALFVRYLVPVINKGLDARSAKIQDQLEQANRLRAEAEALLESYQAEQVATLKQSEEIIACAKRDAAAIRTRAGEELKLALDRRTQQAHEKIARAEAAAIASIRTRIIDAATGSARLMLADQANADADEQAVARAISTIEQQVH
jgi:F-type H+-transporting ATPase subunit b